MNIRIVDNILQLLPIGSYIDTKLFHCDKMRTQQADRRENCCKKWHCNHTTEKPWHGHIAQWIHGHHLHGRELIRRFHETDFGCERCSCTPRKQQCCEHRSYTFSEAETGENASRILSVKLLKTGIGQQASTAPTNNPLIMMTTSDNAPALYTW